LLDQRWLIEQANGVVMGREQVDAQAAFERLRGRARSSTRRLADVAKDVTAGQRLPADRRKLARDGRAGHRQPGRHRGAAGLPCSGPGGWRRLDSQRLEWVGTVVEEPDQLRRARERAGRAKARELAAHRRAAELHEQAAKLQEHLGHADRAQAARERAEHARALHAQALREQADAEAEFASWDGQEGDNSATVC
jgi:hypothetical protein